MMPCQAAVRVSLETVKSSRAGLTEKEAFEKIRWWTPETIAESLHELLAADAIRHTWDHRYYIPHR